VMKTDGRGVMRLTRDGKSIQSMAWSTDGERLLFSSERTGNGDIYVMNADGTGLQRLTRSKAEDRDPSWQPVP
jgi:Tol biopolymer transport system component